MNEFKEWKKNEKDKRWERREKEFKGRRERKEKDNEWKEKWWEILEMIGKKKVGNMEESGSVKIEGRIVRDKDFRDWRKGEGDRKEMMLEERKLGWIMGKEIEKEERKKLELGKVKRINEKWKIKRKGEILERSNIGNKMEGMEKNEDIR